jgi:hypothetical protein
LSTKQTPEKLTNGKRVRGPGKFTKDLRECIEQAFHKAGGRDYLVRVAKRRPDVFLALVGKILPSEVKMSVLAAYQALPSVPVEIRDPIPGQVVIAAPSPAPALPAPGVEDDDWLATTQPQGEPVSVPSDDDEL